VTILLVTATERELGGLDGLVCGIGPVEAAAATARALAADPPDAVLHAGLAGGVELETGTLVVGTESVYVDLAAAIPVVAHAEPDPRLLAHAREAFPESPALPIATSAAVSETRASNSLLQSLRVEAMEGFGVLRACELAGVPALEVRVISNALGEPDRARWELERGLEALAGVLPPLLAALQE
jgi:futalosine hydrolase